MPHITTNTGRLYLADHRKTDSPYRPVLLIHGAGGSHLDWPAGLRRLPQANAIALDLPGHGKSDPPGRSSIDAYAQDVIALLDALELDRVILAGHSMGGAIAQTLALSTPQRVAGLILVGTGARLRVHPDILDRVRTEPEAVAALLKDWMWGPGTPDEMRQIGYQQMLQTPPDVTYGDYLACNGFNLMDRLGDIQAPALVIGGSEDRMTAPKYAEYLRDNIPRAALIMVEGGGHMMALEQPAVVLAAIERWLEAQHHAAA